MPTQGFIGHQTLLLGTLPGFLLSWSLVVAFLLTIFFWLYVDFNSEPASSAILRDSQAVPPKPTVNKPTINW